MISLQGGSAWGLCVTEPIDIRYGVGLRRRVCRRWLLPKLDEWNPRFAVHGGISLYPMVNFAEELQLSARPGWPCSTSRS